MVLALLILTIFIAVGLFGWLFAGALGKGAEKQMEKMRQTTEKDLGDLFIFLDYKKLGYINIAAFLFVPVIVYAVTQNPIFTLASLALPIFAPKMIVSRIRKHRLNKFRMQLPDAMITLSSSLRAGAALSVALENLVRETKPPLNQEFALMLRNQRLGVSFDEALQKMEERVPLQEFFLFSAGTRISREVGGNLATMLDSLADTMFKTLQTEGKIRSLTSQGKLQGLIMALLPLFMMLALTALEPQSMNPLYHSPTGWFVLGVIGVMEILGYLGIRKITDIDV